jgi:hypothetical protein
MGESFQLYFNYRVHLIYKVRPLTLLKMVVERTEGPSLGKTDQQLKNTLVNTTGMTSLQTTLPRLS